MDKKESSFIQMNWQVRHLLLIPVLVIIDLIVNILITDNPVIPLWGDNIGTLIGCAVGGPGYGAIVAILFSVVGAWEGTLSNAILLMAGRVALSMFFGTYVRLGFFANKRGIMIGAVGCAYVDVFLRVPIYMALYGAPRTDNPMVGLVDRVLGGTKIPEPFQDIIAYFIADLADKIIVLFAVYLIVKYMPDKVSDWFSLEKHIPKAVIVNTAEEAEFQSESDRLKEKAKERLEKKKAEESAEGADGAEGVTAGATESKAEGAKEEKA